jgi:hypothetical protein
MPSDARPTLVWKISVSENPPSGRASVFEVLDFSCSAGSEKWRNDIRADLSGRQKL